MVCISIQLFLIRCNNGSLRLWDLSVGPHVQGSLRASFDYPADVQAFSTCMDLCGVTKMVVTARASGPMLALKLANLDLIQELPATPAQLGPIRSCRFSPDGKLLARGTAEHRFDGQNCHVSVVHLLIAAWTTYMYCRLVYNFALCNTVGH